MSKKSRRRRQEKASAEKNLPDERLATAEMFAWFGEDELGHFGVKAGQTPLGVAPLAFSDLETGRHLLPQIRADSARTGRPNYLVRFTKPKLLDVILMEEAPVEADMVSEPARSSAGE